MYNLGKFWTLQDTIKSVGCHKLIKCHLIPEINSVMSTSELSVFMSMRRKGQLTRAILHTYFRSPPSHEMDCILWDLYLNYEKSLDYSDRDIQSQVRWTSPCVCPLQAQVVFDWPGHSKEDTENVSWAAEENGSCGRNMEQEIIFCHLYYCGPCYIWKLWCSRRTDMCFP